MNGMHPCRFEDENVYEYQIWRNVFFAYSQKIDIPTSFIVP